MFKPYISVIVSGRLVGISVKPFPRQSTTLLLQVQAAGQCRTLQEETMNDCWPARQMVNSHYCRTALQETLSIMLNWKCSNWINRDNIYEAKKDPPLLRKCEVKEDLSKKKRLAFILIWKICTRKINRKNTVNYECLVFLDSIIWVLGGMFLKIMLR